MVLHAAPLETEASLHFRERKRVLLRVLLQLLDLLMNEVHVLHVALIELQVFLNGLLRDPFELRDVECTRFVCHIREDHYLLVQRSRRIVS